MNNEKTLVRNRGTLSANKILSKNNQKGMGKEETYVYTKCKKHLNVNNENGMGKQEN